jgi:hypothetical protein
MAYAVTVLTSSIRTIDIPESFRQELKEYQFIFRGMLYATSFKSIFKFIIEPEKRQTDGQILTAILQNTC